MKRYIYIIVALLSIASFIWIFYLNEVVLPAKVKALASSFMEGATGGAVHIGPAKFNILRGVVLSNVLLNDGKDYIFTAKDISCGFLIPALFKKHFVLPVIKIDEPSLYLVRNKDGTFNIPELFIKYVSTESATSGLIVQRLAINNAKVKFVDRTMDPEFITELGGLSVDVRFNVPGEIKFSIERSISDSAIKALDISGRYDIAKKRLEAKIAVKTDSPEAFSRYYENTKMSFTGGEADLLLEFEVKDNEIHYGGVLDVDGVRVGGVDILKEIDDVNGRINFSASSASGKDMQGTVFGIPVKMDINFNTQPVRSFTTRISSDIGLKHLAAILKDEFNIDPGVTIDGDGSISFEARYADPPEPPSMIKGSVRFKDASVYLKNCPFCVEHAGGAFNFAGKSISWEDIGFILNSKEYRSSGQINDISSPVIKAKLSSDEMDADAAFTIKGNIIKFSKLSGTYLNSGFSVTAEADVSALPNIDTDMQGKFDLNLKDLAVFFKESKDAISRIKPAGIVRAEFTLGGDPRYLKSCDIEARLSGENISLYGLKASDATIDYLQTNGMAWLKYIKASFYGGTLEASVKSSLINENSPWVIMADLKGVRIDRLKTDTPFKDKDISGILRFQATLSGRPYKAETLKGTGKVAVTNGKLWQLDLFKGLGMFLFTSDFSNVLFSEGSCSFLVQDGVVSTDDIKLDSDLVYIYGKGSVDTKSSVDALLKAELTDEALEPGMRKNITDAIGNYTIIEITGTLKEPKIKPRPDVGGIIEGIQDSIG